MPLAGSWPCETVCTFLSAQEGHLLLCLHANPQKHDQRQSRLQIAQSAFVWKQRLVATAAAVPQDLIQAFLSAGAVAVISRSPMSTPNSSAAEVAAYFRELYRALFEEQCSILEAVNIAGKHSEHILLYACQYCALAGLVENKLSKLCEMHVSEASMYVLHACLVLEGCYVWILCPHHWHHTKSDCL